MTKNLIDITIQQEVQQIQEYLDIECSDNLEEVLQRIRAIMPYISQTAYLLAETKKAYRSKKATEISNTIVKIAKEQFLFAKAQISFVLTSKLLDIQ